MFYCIEYRDGTELSGPVFSVGEMIIYIIFTHIYLSSHDSLHEVMYEMPIIYQSMLNCIFQESRKLLSF